jgi:hypothetical protein
MSTEHQPIELQVVTVYECEDVEQWSDYNSVHIMLLGQKEQDVDLQIAHWGDDYHDQGRDKAKGFVQGVRWLCTRLGVPLTVTEAKANLEWTVDDAYWTGQNALGEGKVEQDNPFSETEQSELHAAWLRGFKREEY